MATVRERLMTRDEAADFLGLRPQTLAAWVVRRQGPPFIRVGRCVRYRLAVLERWLEARTVGQVPAEAINRKGARDDT